jgi:RsiW-degrading membrane proteinase PrsW (M82 family)
MVPYLTIVAVALLGALNGPWYFFLLGAAVLTFTALRNQRQFQPRFASLGIGELLETAAYASAAHALLAAIAAYGLGVFARLIFV